MQHGMYFNGRILENYRHKLHDHPMLADNSTKAIVNLRPIHNINLGWQIGLSEGLVQSRISRNADCLLQHLTWWLVLCAFCDKLDSTATTTN